MNVDDVVAKIDFLAKTAEHRDLCAFVMEHIENLKSNNRLKDIDKLLSALSPSMSINAWSAVLRSSFSVNAHLIHYARALKNVRDAHIDNPRIDRILIGLNRVYEPMRFY